MKKMTLFAAVAALSIGMINAQDFVTDKPGLSGPKAAGAVFDVLQLDPISVESLKTAGKTVNDFSLDNTTRCWYIWTDTFKAGESSNPGVDDQTEGYISMEVLNQGWSGAGFCILDGSPIDLSHVSEDTHFHMGLNTYNAPASVAVIAFDGKDFADPKNPVASAPFKGSVGKTAFVDNGATFPLLGNFGTGENEGEWVAIDITLKDMKKMWPSFNFNGTKAWAGNIFAILAGGVPGTAVQIDAVYFYTPSGSGSVGSISSDDVAIIVSDKTISAAGTDNAPMQLINMGGQTVKTSNTSIMGVENIANGIYIVKTAGVTKKVIIK